MNIFEDKSTMDEAKLATTKVAQSVEEQRKNYTGALAGDFGARSVEHAERPRYGHKV